VGEGDEKNKHRRGKRIGGERETIQRKKNRARKQRKNKQKRTQHRKKNRARKQRKKQAEKEEPPERTGIIITFVPSSLKKKTRSREEMNEA
jgi:hypothetical protein